MLRLGKDMSMAETSRVVLAGIDTEPRLRTHTASSRNKISMIFIEIWNKGHVKFNGNVSSAYC